MRVHVSNLKMNENECRTMASSPNCVRFHLRWNKNASCPARILRKDVDSSGNYGLEMKMTDFSFVDLKNIRLNSFVCRAKDE